MTTKSGSRCCSLRLRLTTLLLMLFVFCTTAKAVVRPRVHDREEDLASTTMSSTTMASGLTADSDKPPAPTAVLFQLETDEFSDHDHEEGGEEDIREYHRRRVQSQSDTSRVNILQKLGESLGMTIIGALLICVMPFLIWKNEGRHARELTRISYCKNEAVAIDCETVGEETTGRMVHFSGTVTVGDDSLEFDKTTTDHPQLNLSHGMPKALILKRTCYIYQKFEDTSRSVDQDRIGGGETRTTTVTMREDWTPMGPQLPQLEHMPEHTNSRGIWDQLQALAGPSCNGGASAMPLENLPPALIAKMGLYDANQAPHGLLVHPNARVGGFGLTRDVVTQNPNVFLTAAPSMAIQMPGPQEAAAAAPPPPVESYLKAVPNIFVPDSIPDCPQLLKGSDNVLRTFPEGSDPQNGDCKVVYEFALDGFDASFVVAQVKLGITATNNNNNNNNNMEEQPEYDNQKKEEDIELQATAAKASYGIDKAEVMDDTCFGTCHNDMGTIWMVRRGLHNLEDMIDMAKVDESNVTKILRVVCWALLCAGWSMLFAPFSAALSVLPLLGNIGNAAIFIVALIVSCLCCLTITTLAYIRYRPLIASGMLLVAGGIWGIVAWRLNIAAEDGGTAVPTAAPTTGSLLNNN